MKIPQKSWKMWKFHEISWNLKKIPIFANFLYSGGSETLIFLRKNNDLGAGPPKDTFLAKFPQKSWNSSILSISGGNWLKSEKKVILDGFCDFRSDRTPPEPMNLLCISMVWGAFGRPSVRGGWFSIFHENFKKFHKIHEIYAISWNFKKIHEINENHGNSWFLWFWTSRNLDIP